MKKMIIAVAALLMSAATFAQTSTAAKEAPASGAVEQTNLQKRRDIDPAQAGKRETERINGLVALGGAYDKVLAINTEFAKKRRETKSAAAKEMTKEQSDALRLQMKALNDAHRKDLEAAMGADLYTKYQAAIKAQREQRKEARKQGAMPAPAPAAK